jgi:hypothetical protein
MVVVTGEVGWSDMDSKSKVAGNVIRKNDIPGDPGIYAWYRDGKRMYLGKAANLQNRIWNNHLGRGICLTGSAFRRNVAEHLGIATAADIKSRRRAVTRSEADAVCAWIAKCELTWIVGKSDADALCAEQKLKREFCPPLTKL